MLSITIKRRREKVVITTANDEKIEIRLAKRNKAPFARLLFEAEKNISVKRIPLEIVGDVCRCEFCNKVVPWRFENKEEKKKIIFCSRKCAVDYEVAWKEYSPLKGGPV